MNLITLKIHNLRITRYTTLSNLNITLARHNSLDNQGLFTDDEAREVFSFLETQPIVGATITNILCEPCLMVDEETGGTESYSPYMMPFGTGGFKANLRDWCSEYSLAFDVEVLYYEYDSDYKCVSTHLINTRKRKQQEFRLRLEQDLMQAGMSTEEIQQALDIMEK